MANVYEAAARFYDALSGERLVYRAGRESGVALLGLRPGDTVLDVGSASLRGGHIRVVAATIP